MSIETYFNQANCGCSLKIEYNDDPYYNGYESDREEKTYTFCESHKKERKDLQEQRKLLEKEIEKLNNQLHDIHQKQIKFLSIATGIQ
jgi:septal ring factor EnvC (AmiA/AmiB activator)